VEQGVVTLTSSEGLVLRALASGPVRAGDAVQGFVRPEVASLSRDAAPFASQGLPHYTGRVESILFDGANSAVLLREQASNVEFRIALPQTGQFSDLRVGESVVFGFDPQRAVCFASQAPGHAD
jgi:spermidine/putrescine transport system ATP-binding protein